MSPRLRTLVAVVALGAGLAAAGAILHAREVSFTLPESAEQILYLRSGRVADRLMLSFKAVAADVYWIRAIQHYGRERDPVHGSGQFLLLQPLLDLTTTLDPRFNIAYRFGAIFLSMQPPNGPARSDQAIALLEKGLANNPTRWQYAHDIGFIEYWYTGNRAAAASWFARAAAMPGAPGWIRPLAATAMIEGGDRQAARAMLNELRGSEEKYVRNAADRGLAQLQALDDLDGLQALITQYVARTGSYPADMSQLMRSAGYSGVPIDPARVPYQYFPATHRVDVAASSPLNPLPRTLQAK